MQISRNFTSSAINPLNKKKVSFSRSLETQYFGQEAARLMAQNKKIEKFGNVDNVFKFLWLALNPTNRLKAFELGKTYLTNGIKADALIEKGERYAAIDKKLKQTGFIA